MRDYEFPEFRMRENYYAGTYCEIAMESFYDAMQYLKKIEAKSFHPSTSSDVVFMERKIVSTIVFSAMCVESFLNDYAATVLGDNEFYENFDKLSALSKLKLISKFIFKTELDKGSAFYGYIKTLFKRRDTYVHNKSKQFVPAYTEVEFQKVQKDLEESGDLYSDDYYMFPKDEIYNTIQEGRESLTSIKQLVDFFDKHDPNVYAMSLFHPLGLILGNDIEIKYKKAVFEILEIKEPVIK